MLQNRYFVEEDLNILFTIVSIFAMTGQRAIVTAGRPKVTERYRRRNHSGKGRISFTLMPSCHMMSSLNQPPRRTWKIIRPMSCEQIIVPVYCHDAPGNLSERCPRNNKKSVKPSSYISSNGPNKSEVFDIAKRRNGHLSSAINNKPSTENLMLDCRKGTIVHAKGRNFKMGSVANILERKSEDSRNDFMISVRDVSKQTDDQESLNRCVSEITNQNKPRELVLQKISRPSFLPTTNHNNNNDVDIDETAAKNESDELVADCTNVNDTKMGVDTTTTRGGTLSQPCLPVSTTIGATRIFPHLYLGSQKDVVDEEMMRANGITYVLNVSKKCMQPNFIDDSHFHRISVRDSYQEMMTPYIIEAIEFIENVRKSNQRVLVHCLAGVSRSATVAIAYVLHYLRISFEDAYRFVKEKRPSISPNFNFLGQLMEFEKTLRQSGHMGTKRTGSLSENGEDGPERSQLRFDCHYDQDRDDEASRNSLRLNILKKKTECSPLFMPATCSFQCTTPASPPTQTETPLRVSTPTSSFCRRRNAPTLSKNVFTLTCNRNNASKATCDTPMPKHMDDTQTSILVDVRVDVLPPTSRMSDTSRRLGSDGNEVEDPTTCESDNNLLSTETFTSSAQSMIFNRVNHEAMDCSIPTIKSAQDKYDDNFAKPKTAPSTPLIRRHDSGKNGPSRHSLAPPKPALRHRRCASGGGVTEILLSPFNMKRRFECRTERSASIDDVRNDINDDRMEVESGTAIKRVSSFSASSYYDHSEPSTRSPHKFISVNSRSPKILRKNFNLNLRPVYTVNAAPRVSSKSETAHAPHGTTTSVFQVDTPVPRFDCSHSLSTPTNEPLRFHVNKNKSEGEQKSDDTLVINSMSPLTLSEKDDSMLYPKATSPATCPVMGSSTTPNEPSSPCGFSTLSGSKCPKSSQLVHKGSFTYSSRETTEIKANRPFMLSAGCDLRLRWRNKDRRRQSADSGYLSSSQASSQSSSSFTSPVSQQTVFGSCASTHESFADTASEADMVPQHSNSTCHAEGAYVTNGDDVTSSVSEPDPRKSSPVGRRCGLEIMSYS